MTVTSLHAFKQKLAHDFIAYDPHHAAVVLDQLPASEMRELLDNIENEETINVIKKISIDTLKSFVDIITDKEAASLLKKIHVERAAKVYNNLSNEKKARLKSLIPKSLKNEFADIYEYPEGTAGSIMDPDIVTFYPQMTVQQAIDKIRAQSKRGIRLVFIVNDRGELDSMVSMQALMMADSKQTLKEISKPIPDIVSDIDPQDEIIAKLEAHGLTDIPVENINHKFVGVVRYHALIQVTKEELTKDIQKMVGVSEDEKALSPVFFAVRKRLPWLEINLLTAFLAAAVVGIFESTIAKYTALAVLLPVVAGQSGNTGAQALAVTMRGLALKEVRLSHWWVLAIKELKISFITGLLVACTTSLGVFFWSQSFGLTFIIGISMVLSMVMASLSGALVPIILKKLHQDPASSSSIILTTVTDVFGFFSFLGIATLLSRFI